MHLTQRACAKTEQTSLAGENLQGRTGSPTVILFLLDK